MHQKKQTKKQTCTGVIIQQFEFSFKEALFQLNLDT